MIERAKIKESLDAWMDWYKKAHAGLFRRNLKITLPQNNALVLTGVRRSGKTFTAVEISKKEETLYFNFEDPITYIDNKVNNLDEIISVFTEYSRQEPKLIILDEIQNISGWEKWVRKAIDTNKYKLILTGSSAKLLSSEISTAISGRCVEQNIWPLSFIEYLTFSQKKCNTANEYIGELREYLQWGGFPAVTLATTKGEKEVLLKQYLNDILYKDVINRHEIRNQKTLRQLTIFYFTNISSLHSYSSIKNAFNINATTANEYTQYLSEAFLFFEINRYHPNLKVQIRDSKKIYAIDNGMRNLHSFTANEDIGKLAENAAFIELLRRGSEITYFKEKGEVDFLIVKNGRPVTAIQVCYSNLDDKETETREVNSLLECLAETKLQEGIILTFNREEVRKINDKTIKFVPLYKWLLQ